MAPSDRVSDPAVVLAEQATDDIEGMGFKDRIAVVTGATRGIGKAIALELAKKGCHIAFNYHSREDQAVSLIGAIKELGRDAAGYHVDVSDFGAVKNMIREIKEHFGRIDFLVNNAGITRDTTLLMMEEKDWDDVINTNLKGVFNCTKAVIYSMMKEKKGRILNITSITGLIGQKGQVNYSSSKAGVVGFTKSLAKELAPLGMTVNAIAAGFIETDMTSTMPEKHRKKMLETIPLGRFGTAAEVAQIAVFFLSDAARYVTGQIIKVDGGLAI